MELFNRHMRSGAATPFDVPLPYTGASGHEHSSRVSQRCPGRHCATAAHWVPCCPWLAPPRPWHCWLRWHERHCMLKCLEPVNLLPPCRWAARWTP